MAVEAIVGGIVGGLARLAPEVLAHMDKKNERKHELALGEQHYRVAELQTKTQMAVKDLDVEQTQFASGMAALTQAIQSQSVSTGIKWVDAFSAMIRPGVTVWIFFLYSMLKSASLLVALKSNDLATAVMALWTPNDEAMLSTVLMFWFVGRVWDRTQFMRTFR